MASRFHLSDIRNWKLGTLFVHPAFIFACASIGAIVGSTVLWNKYRTDLFAANSFQFDETTLACNEQPEWIKGNLKQNIWQANQLGQTDLLDAQLVPKIADAFANSSWVARVNRINKHASGVEVDLLFRRPVALVEVANNQLVPIDEAGTVLDSHTMSPEFAQHCWRLHVNQPAAASILDGQAWPDRRIADAGALASALFELRQKLGMTHILQLASSHQYEISRGPFVLSKPGGAKIIWGASPNYEVDGEATFQKKLAAIEKWLKTNQSFDEFSKQQSNKMLVIDLRQGNVTIQWQASTSTMTSSEMTSVERN